jgi:glycolate oxidase
MDEICLNVISKKHGLEFGGAQALLLVEFSGSKTVTEQSSRELEALIKSKVEIPKIWEIRKGLVPLLSIYSSNLPLAITEDIGVPVSMTSDAVKLVKEIYNTAGFEVAVYGHLGDGSLHMRVFGEHSPALQRAADEVYSYVISVGGTISSEHGVGRLRTKYMLEAHKNTLPLMKEIKSVIDRDNLLNPGCLFD